MTVQMSSQRRGGALIEKNPHKRAGTRRASASCSSTARTCQASTPGNQSRNWPTVAPLSRFSKRADTGTRVPANVQAPLSLPGRRSTAGHRSQSVTPSPPFHRYVPRHSPSPRPLPRTRRLQTGRSPGDGARRPRPTHLPAVTHRTHPALSYGRCPRPARPPLTIHRPHPDASTPTHPPASTTTATDSLRCTLESGSNPRHSEPRAHKTPAATPPPPGVPRNAFTRRPDIDLDPRTTSDNPCRPDARLFVGAASPTRPSSGRDPTDPPNCAGPDSNPISAGKGRSSKTITPCT